MTTTSPPVTSATPTVHMLGHAEGETCHRDGCVGVIALHEPDGCSCHISPPCGSCTAARGYCPKCDWQERDDQFLFNDYIITPNPNSEAWKAWEPRPLDPSKLDWRSRAHSNASMIKEGVYPESMTLAEVEKAVRGTFGGHFKRFGNGRFEYVAYTD